VSNQRIGRGSGEERQLREPSADPRPDLCKGLVGPDGAILVSIVTKLQSEITKTS
jgi:hypothetical protein